MGTKQRPKNVIMATLLVCAVAFGLTGCTTSEDNSNGNGNSGSKELMNVGKPKYDIEDVRKDSSLLEGSLNSEALYERFNWQSSSDPQIQLLASSTAEYLDKAIYNPYYLSGWWQTKDDFGTKGLKHVRPLVDDPLFDMLVKSIKTERGLDVVGSRYIFIQPKSIQEQGYTANTPCAEEWIETGCMSPDKTETFSILSQAEGSLQVGVTSDFTVYLADANGETVDQNVKLDLIITYVNNNRLKDLKTDTFYSVGSISGKINYGEPKSVE